MGQQAHASVVAVTGGMGSGKSSVSAYLCEISGAQGLNADSICRQLLEPEASGWLAVRQAFGERFFLPDRAIDRALLRKVLFAEQEFRRELNALLHPLVREVITGCITKELALRSQAQPRFVVEVPLLYEAHWEHDFSPVVVIYADEKVSRHRLMHRDGISEAEAEKAMAAQMPLSAKAFLADHVIDNSGPWSDTCLQILHLSKLLWQGASHP